MSDAPPGVSSSLRPCDLACFLPLARVLPALLRAVLGNSDDDVELSEEIEPDSLGARKYVSCVFPPRVCSFVWYRFDPLPVRLEVRVVVSSLLKPSLLLVSLCFAV